MPLKRTAKRDQTLAPNQLDTSSESPEAPRRSTTQRPRTSRGKGKSTAQSTSKATTGNPPSSIPSSIPTSRAPTHGSVPQNPSPKTYNIRDDFLNRKVVDHFYLDRTLFQRWFPRMMATFSYQNWNNLLDLKAPIYADAVREFYSNFKFNKQGSERYITTKVLGKFMRITEDLLGEILDVEPVGVVADDYESTDFKIESLATTLAQIYRPGTNIVNVKNKWPSANHLFFDAKLIQFVLAKIIRPISASYNDVPVEVSFYIIHLLNHTRINLPRLIMLKMRDCLSNKTYRLSYGALITKICERFEIPLIGETIPPKKHAQIGKPSLTLMNIIVSADNIVTWEGVQVSGPNFAPLSRADQIAKYGQSSGTAPSTSVPPPTSAPSSSAPPPTYSPNPSFDENIPYAIQIYDPSINVNRPYASTSIPSPTSNPPPPPSSSSSRRSPWYSAICLGLRRGKRTRKLHREIRESQGRTDHDSLDEESEEDRKFREDFSEEDFRWGPHFGGDGAPSVF